MKPDEVEALVAAVSEMSLDELRVTWGKRYGAPPSLRSVPIMQMMLAWRVQAEAFGGIDSDTRRVLSRVGAVQAEGRSLGIGARLTRQWQGREIEVIVEEDGFRWGTRLFPSLSAAATAIAGSKWNGPRFFGLRDQALADG